MGNSLTTEKCAGCYKSVVFKPADDIEGNPLMSFNPDGSKHNCKGAKKIGSAIEGHVLESFKLRERRLVLEFDGKLILEVYAKYPANPDSPLALKLYGPHGMLEE